MDNKEKILESALELFYTKGYDAVGVQEIADRSGITKPTLYHYFGSKYGLLESLRETEYTKFRKALETAAVYDGDLPMTLYRFVSTYFEMAWKNAKFYKLFMSMLYAGEASEMHRAVLPYATDQLNMLTALFLKAGNIIGNMNGRQEQYAVTLIGMISHSLLLWLNRNEDAFIGSEKAFAIVHQFLHGIYV